MKSGLEVLLGRGARSLKGLRVGFCCNHTAVDSEMRHAIDLLTAQGVDIVRLFGPEHGVRATAQDMEGVDETADPVTGVPTVSLYGDTEDSLKPREADLVGLDVILFDIQDIGARYYTYQATLGFMMEVAGRLGIRVIVLDRPNPINGVDIEGNLVAPGYSSFVGAYPIANRHGLTMGELSQYFQRHCGVACETTIVQCEGWMRQQWLDEVGGPWVYPSPNMPTLETAAIYPGMCLVEGINFSEGRGTTRPFHLMGAPWVDPQRLTGLCQALASENDLSGVLFRPAAFHPAFQKHGGIACQGVEVHVMDRRVMNATLLGMVCVAAAYQCEPDQFEWRTETYEFVDEPIAIDLLMGGHHYRDCVESRGRLADLYDSWAGERAEFSERREPCLLYRD
jgi:uncharacterized protein YbbC (DUF1343 family)